MKYVVCKASVNAGLGDLLLAVITSIAYAKLTDRHLCIDWRHGVYGMPPDENLFEKIFKIKGIEYSSKIPQTDLVNPPIWKNSLDKSFDQLRKENNFPEFDRKLAIEQYSVDYTKLDHDEEMVVIWDFDNFDHLIGPLVERGIIEEPESTLHAMGQIYSKYVEFQDEPSQFIQDRLDKIFSEVNNSNVVGVHVRETQESFDCYRPAKRRNYFKKVKSILDRDKKIEYIFLATDNSNVQKQFISKFGKKVLVNEKWFDKPGDALHLSIDHCPDKWENILNAFTEIYALARCDYLIRRRETSFSRISECVGLFDKDKVEIIEKEKPMRIKASIWKNKMLAYINNTKDRLVNVVSAG